MTIPPENAAVNKMAAKPLKRAVYQQAVRCSSREPGIERWKILKEPPFM